MLFKTSNCGQTKYCPVDVDAGLPSHLANGAPVRHLTSPCWKQGALQRCAFFKEKKSGKSSVIYYIYFTCINALFTRTWVKKNLIFGILFAYYTSIVLTIVSKQRCVH